MRLAAAAGVSAMAPYEHKGHEGTLIEDLRSRVGRGGDIPFEAGADDVFRRAGKLHRLVCDRLGHAPGHGLRPVLATLQGLDVLQLFDRHASGRLEQELGGSAVLFLANNLASRRSIVREAFGPRSIGRPSRCAISRSHDAGTRNPARRSPVSAGNRVLPNEGQQSGKHAFIRCTAAPPIPAIF